MSVTVATLSGRPGTLLYCPTCGAEFSAWPGDYFWKDDGQPADGLVEVTRHVVFEEVTP